MKLQMNTNGAWRNVVEFEPARRSEIRRAAAYLSAVLDGKCKFCIEQADPDGRSRGKREWIRPDWLALSRVDA